MFVTCTTVVGDDSILLVVSTLRVNIFGIEEWNRCFVGESFLNNLFGCSFSLLNVEALVSSSNFIIGFKSGSFSIVKSFFDRVNEYDLLLGLLESPLVLPLLLGDDD